LKKEEDHTVCFMGSEIRNVRENKKKQKQKNQKRRDQTDAREKTQVPSAKLTPIASAFNRRRRSSLSSPLTTTVPLSDPTRAAAIK
jgi:hypothetical protein